MKTKIPFLDIAAMHADLAPELDEAWRRVSTSGKFVGGEFVDRFEESWAAYCGTSYCVGVSDGTSALELALRALGTCPGDEVIVPANTFIATWEAIIAVGAKPIAIDVDPLTLLMTAEAIEAARGKRTVGVIAVHLFGQPANMDLISRAARRAGLWIVEDAAQAHGATWRGKRAGSLADIGCFSFYPGKNLGAYGEAGAAVTNSSDLARQLALLRDWGQESKYNHVLPGYNFRMDGIQGAILNVKMAYIESWTEARQAVASHYDRLLARAQFKRPAPPPHCRHVYHVYAVEVEHRDQVQKALSAAGIGTGIHYPVPVHLQKAYGELGYGRGDFPVTEAIANRFLSLPIYAELQPEQVANVVLELENAALVRAG